MQLRPDLVITAFGCAVVAVATVISQGTTNPVILARWFLITTMVTAFAGNFARPFGG